MTQRKKELILFSLFVTAMVLVNTIGLKMISLFSVRVSVGIFFMPVLFLITDVVGEVKGKKEALFFVRVASSLMLLLVVVLLISVYIPADKSYPYQKEYDLMLHPALRMTVASFIAFLVSQHIDVFVFHVLSKLCNKRYLWIRNNLSTMLSQLIDTTLFAFIGFYHLTPVFDIPFIIAFILRYWSFKVVFSACDTPICYILVQWFSGKKTKRTVEQNKLFWTVQ